MNDEIQADKLLSWKSFFQCCFKKSITNNGIFEEDSSKYEYIVEKLIIKRVPINVFTSQYDIYKIDTSNILNDATFSNDDQVKFQPLSPTLETSSATLKSNLQSTLHNPVSGVNSQFSKISHEVTPIQSTKKESSALERSLHGNESEVSDVEVEISNRKEAIEDYTPDKIFSPRSFQCYKLENTSCPSFNQRNLKAQSENIEIKRHLQQLKQPKHRPQTPERLRKVPPNTDFIVAPVEVHYESPNLRSMRKPPKEIEPSIFNRQPAFEERKSPVEESSAKSENYRADEAAETTLKWKIIIKHHQPNTSENKN